MADLVIIPADVSLVRAGQEDLLTLPTGVAVVAGQYVQPTVNGVWALGDALVQANLDNGYVTVNSAAHVGDAVTALKRGLLNVGPAIDALAFNAPVYVSDTPGALGSEAADATVPVIVCRVVPAWGDTVVDRLLAVDIADYQQVAVQPPPGP